MKFQCGKEKTAKCPYCPVRSRIKYDIKRHVRRLHPENYKEFVSLFKALY